MMKSAAVISALALSAEATTMTVNEKATAGANPIRKVVTMLQNIQKKVEKEAEAEKELFEKYMCYCKNGKGDLEQSIAGSDAKIPEVESAIKAAEAQKKQLDEDLVAHRSDREEAKSAIAKATAIRDKEAKTYGDFKTETETNVAAINKAVKSLESGMAGSFLQTPSAQTLKSFVQMKAKISDVDRDDVMAFLAGSSQEGYAPQSGEITGILKTMGEEMSKDLAEATATEEGSIKSYNELVSAKEKEIEALTASIEDKTVRSGEVAVSIVEMENDLSDTEAALVDDKKFLADLDKNCKTKEAEWAEIEKSRSEEQVALSDTIKLLNDDDALELFKKTLPSAASFVQVQTRSSEMRSQAMAAIRAAQAKGGKEVRQKLDFILLALHGKKGGFEKVIGMIDTMMGVLKKEQVDDDNKKEYCETSFDSADDKKKGLEVSIKDSEKAIADTEEGIASLKSEIKALKEGVTELDKSVVEATEQRQKENGEYKELMASNTAAVDLIGLAKNRLNKFYNPKLYKAPPKRELSEEDRIAVNMGGTAPPTPAPGGIAGTGITALAEVSAAPPAAPEAPKAYSKKSEESNGVIAMMDLLIKDLEKEMQVAETAEKDAQADYEQMSEDAKEKRAADVQLAAEKESATAEAEGALQRHMESKLAANKELMATLEFISGLHGECDWLMQNYDTRKEARAGEVESLDKAKAVLSGADYSLLQQASAHRSLKVRRV